MWCRYAKITYDCNRGSKRKRIKHHLQVTNRSGSCGMDSTGHRLYPPKMRRVSRVYGTITDYYNNFSTLPLSYTLNICLKNSQRGL